MCRLGFVSSKDTSNVANVVIAASSLYSKSNDDGFGFSFYNNDNIITHKTDKNAAYYWITSKRRNIATKSLIFHNRFSTSGKVMWDNSHPFTEDGISICHNGCLTSYTPIKNKLIELGHVFKSEVDSEVFLHAYQQWGTAFLDKIKESGAYGSATILILKKDSTILAYTNNNNLVYHKVNNTIYGFSDDDPMGKGVEIEKNKIFEIKDGELRSIHNTEFDSWWNSKNSDVFTYKRPPKACGVEAYLEKVVNFDQANIWYEELGNCFRITIRQCPSGIKDMAFKKIARNWYKGDYNSIYTFGNINHPKEALIDEGVISMVVKK